MAVLLTGNSYCTDCGFTYDQLVFLIKAVKLFKINEYWFILNELFLIISVI